LSPITVAIWEILDIFDIQKPPTVQGEHSNRDLRVAPCVGPKAKSVELVGFIHALVIENQRFMGENSINE